MGESHTQFEPEHEGKELYEYSKSELVEELCKRGYCIKELKDGEMLSVGYSTIVGAARILVVKE